MAEAAPIEVEPLPVGVFDAHTHLDAMAERAEMQADDAYVDTAMAAARAVGVYAAVTVGTSVQDSRWVVAAARRHRDLYGAVAVHPTEVGRGLSDDDYAALEECARDPRVVAIGETGLDYYWDRTDREVQQREFRRHIELARAVGKPLMIHDRDAHADVLRIVAESPGLTAVVFHAFSGDAEMAQRCVAAGYLLSFPGVVTFKNAPALRAAAAVTPAEHVLVETDAPFLAPHPYRGRANAPALLPVTVRGLAAAMGQDVESLAAAVQRTGHERFGIPPNRT